ncbi:uncharacterized protein METZ01_LOCUS165605 [marine metagenome]|jgi:hypothetical protein|uniref:NIF system FeS cluster assembly NifU N-terminal domain-containing protein n=1 Tax=marine metagenome TaxID=408172 RepID=A0A382BGX1_9ZZZZ
MPCKDTTAEITLQLDDKDCLVDFSFSKITCSKKIGGGTGYLEYCKGKSAEEILDLEINELLDFFCLESEEDHFLLYMEWEALHAAISQLLGISINNKRYQIASISCDENGTTINQIMSPLKEMPKVVSCLKREKNTLK